jgi:hypothetical protein
MKSKEGEVPEVDPRKLDHITSIITTFEQRDLKAQSSLSYYYDKSNDYIFLELVGVINGQRVADQVFGFDKEKILTACDNLKKFFADKNI